MLRCIFLNVNSVVSIERRHYLNNFIKKHKPDILLLAEHKMSHRHKLQIEGYALHRQCRVDKKGGGTAIMIKSSYKYEEFTINTGNIESCAIKLYKTEGLPIIFVSMYLAPKTSFRPSSLDEISNLGANNDIVIGCDLNAKHRDWGIRINNVNGCELRDCLLCCPTSVPQGSIELKTLT